MLRLCLCMLTGVALGLVGVASPVRGEESPQWRGVDRTGVSKEAGLLADRQSGRWVYYRLRPEAIEQLRGWLGDLAAHCSTPAETCC